MNDNHNNNLPILGEGKSAQFGFLTRINWKNSNRLTGPTVVFILIYSLLNLWNNLYNI